MASFRLHPHSQFESGQTVIRRPRQFLQFSYDENQELKIGSEESMRYYYPPFTEAPGEELAGVPLPAVNLSKGYDAWVQKPGGGSLDNLLKTIMTHEKDLVANGVKAKDARVQADIITWRGQITKVLTALYDQYSDFEMNATLFQDTIYIEDNPDYESVDKESQRKRHYRPFKNTPELMQYWGYKFETLSTLPRPWAECTREEIEGRDEEFVNNNAEYCSIVRTTIGSTSMVIAGEVDCVMGGKPDNPDDPIPWVELKTSKEPGHNEREQMKFENKLCKFWAQSFLLGVPKVIVGWRDDDGYLYKLSEFDTQRIPGQVTRNYATWNGNVCINFAAQFFDWLKSKIDGKDGVWRIARHKNSHIMQLMKIEHEGSGNVISAEFKAHREELLARQVAEGLADGSPQ